MSSYHDRAFRKKVKRVRFRECKTDPMADPTQLVGTEKRLVRWLRKHVSTSWNSVQRAFKGYSKRQQNDFVRSHLSVMLDMYVEEHPTLRKGVYYYCGSEEPVTGPGIFFVDSSGILREAPLQSLG